MYISDVLGKLKSKYRQLNITFQYTIFFHRGLVLEMTAKIGSKLDAIKTISAKIMDNAKKKIADCMSALNILIMRNSL